MGTQYKSTVEITCWKEHDCVGCGGTFRYSFQRKATGMGATGPAASEAAMQSLALTAKHDADFRPCPSCGLYQPDMVGGRKATIYGWLLAGFAIAIGIVAIVALIMSDSSSLQLPWITGITAGLAALVILTSIWAIFHNPNRNKQANLGAAQGPIIKEELLLVQAGDASQGEATPPGVVSAGHHLALVLLFIGLGLIVLGEGTRLARGWPLNKQCFPQVVGPGDTPCVYLPDELSCVQGMWNGSGTATVVRPAEFGLKVPKLLASTKNSTWGNRISGKDVSNSTRQLYMYVQIPESGALSGRTLPLLINMHANYPHAERGGFVNADQNFSRTADIQLATPHAGASYRDMVIWAGLGGVGLILLMLLHLRRLAKQMRHAALPARLIPLGQENAAEDDAPEALPGD